MDQTAGTVAVMGEQAKMQFLHDVMGQVVWTARQNDWAGAVPSRVMQTLADNIAYVVDNMKSYLTRSMFQALFSVVGRAVRLLGRPPQPVKAQPLQACIYATRILFVLTERRLSPSAAADPTPFPGQIVSEEHIVSECLRGVSHLKAGWLQRSNSALLKYLTVLFNNFWLVATRLAGATDKTRNKAVRFLQQSMTDPIMVDLLAVPAIMNGGFLRSYANVVRCLAKGDVANWAVLVAKLTASLLQINIARNQKVHDLLAQVRENESRGVELHGAVGRLKHTVAARVNVNVNANVRAVGGAEASRLHNWLGALDTQRLSAYLMLFYERNNLHIQGVTLFRRLLTDTVPAPSFLGRLMGSTAHAQLLRNAVIKGAVSPSPRAGADAPAKGGTATAEAPPATALRTAVLAAAAASADGFETPAKIALKKALLRFAVDGRVEPCDADLPDDVRAKFERVWFAYLCAACKPAQWVGALAPTAKARVAEATREMFVGTLLADELLFTSRERTTPNMPFVVSKHMLHHHKAFALHGPGVPVLLQVLPAAAKRDVIGDLAGHAAGVGRLLTEVLERSRQTQNDQMYVNLDAFLKQSFAVILSFVKGCAPGLQRRELNDDEGFGEAEATPAAEPEGNNNGNGNGAPDGNPQASPATPAGGADVAAAATPVPPVSGGAELPPNECKLCLDVLEEYFGTFKYTSLPSLPPPADARRMAIQQYRKRVADRMQYVDLTKVMTSLLAVLEADRTHSTAIVAAIADAERQSAHLSGQAGQVQVWWRLVFRLLALRLALPSVQKQSPIAAMIPKFLKYVTGRYPQPILNAAHSLTVALLRRQSPEAAKGFAMYVSACVPCEVVRAGDAGERTELRADLRRLPSVPLLREFTRHIRGVCQNVEEWEDFTTAEDATGMGVPAVSSLQHAANSGVGLVLYTVEALRTVILAISPNSPNSGGQNSVARYLRRLYISTLVHLLQCRHTYVLTKVCASLESIFSSLADVREVAYWLGYTSKSIKDSHNPSTKQQVVTWFLTLQSLLSPEKLGPHAFRAKL